MDDNLMVILTAATMRASMGLEKTIQIPASVFNNASKDDQDLVRKICKEKFGWLPLELTYSTSEHDYYETKAPILSLDTDPTGKRFIITFAWALSVFLIMVYAKKLTMGFVAINELATIFIVAVFLALFPGIVSMLMPTNRKIIYVPISILICLIIVVIWFYSI